MGNRMNIDIKRYFSFLGRASRSEFWTIMLIVAFIVLFPAYMFFEPYSEQANQYVNIMALVTLWPYVAVQVRRWHDRNKSGWWFLINFVPVIGLLWVLIELGLLPSISENNKY